MYTDEESNAETVQDAAVWKWPSQVTFATFGKHGRCNMQTAVQQLCSFHPCTEKEGRKDKYTQGTRRKKLCPTFHCTNDVVSEISAYRKLTLDTLTLHLPCTPDSMERSGYLTKQMNRFGGSGITDKFPASRFYLTVCKTSINLPFLVEISKVKLDYSYLRLTFDPLRVCP